MNKYKVGDSLTDKRTRFSYEVVGVFYTNINNYYLYALECINNGDIVYASEKLLDDNCYALCNLLKVIDDLVDRTVHSV